MKLLVEIRRDEVGEAGLLVVTSVCISKLGSDSGNLSGHSG